MKRTAISISLALLFSCAVSIARAQDGDGGGDGDPDPAASRSASFQAVDGAVREDIAGGPLLLGAYGTILTLLLGYVLWIGRLQAGTTRDLDQLRRAVERAGAKKD